MKKAVLILMTIGLLGTSLMSLTTAAHAALPEANVGEGATPVGEVGGSDDEFTASNDADFDSIAGPHSDVAGIQDRLAGSPTPR